jgi:hypothetical protein
MPAFASFRYFHPHYWLLMVDTFSIDFIDIDITLITLHIDIDTYCPLIIEYWLLIIFRFHITLLIIIPLIVISHWLRHWLATLPLRWHVDWCHW